MIMDFDTLKQKFENDNVTLVAVSKTHHPKEIKKIYNKGQFDFGENRVQELMEKVDLPPQDIRWHMVGHLQSNKVRDLVPFIHLIHSLDRFSLAKEIQKHAKRYQRKISVLLQFKIAEEESKHGIDPDNLKQFMDECIKSDYDHIKVKGVMGMATFTEDEDQIKREYKLLDEIYHQLKEDYFLEEDEFEIKRYGMSGDYQIDLDQGSNMVRIGTLIFGELNQCTTNGRVTLPIFDTTFMK